MTAMRDNPITGLATADAAAQGPVDKSGEAYRFSPALPAMETPPRSPAAVAVSGIAAALITQQLERGRRGVAVCGASAGAGVTFVAGNLAVAITRAGYSVLLVDANLHGAGVEALFVPPADGPQGLQQVLRPDGAPLYSVIHREVIPGLSILYNGGATPDASELLGAATLRSVLDECLRDYDYTVFDTPPANRSPDARRVASIVGYSLIVARRDLTYADDVSTLARELASDGALVIGTLFNDR